MKLSAIIRISNSAKELKKLFETENSELKNERASYSFKSDKNDFLITITADDASAFRAILNSVAKLISIYEKTGIAVKNEN
jgi:tRNA threonylcarbamoyladenosine modification (KEOPS) complex  Pcc1 subunit